MSHGFGRVGWNPTLRGEGGDPGQDGVAQEPESWDSRTANLLKAELKRKGVTYTQLFEKLAAMGITETEVNIANRSSRGKFGARFVLQCLSAIGATDLLLD